MGYLFVVLSNPCVNVTIVLGKLSELPFSANHRYLSPTNIQCNFWLGPDNKMPSSKSWLLKVQLSI